MGTLCETLAPTGIRVGNRRLAGLAAIATLLVAAFLALASMSTSMAFADEGDPGASPPAASRESGESANGSSPASTGIEIGAGEGKGEDEDDDKDNRVDPTQRADNSFIYDTTIDSLFEQASLYEDDTVQVVGEVIGDLISAGRVGEREMCWITLTATEAENKATISVLLSTEQAQQIDHFGRYGVTGTILQVRGTFHQACAEHQGLPDIHATDTSPVSRGIEHPDQFEIDQFIPGIIAMLLGVALMGVYYFVRERSR